MKAKTVYSVDFVGEGNVIKLKARANPNLILAIIQRYGDHGKITNFHLDGQLFTALPRGGFSSPSGFYHPSTAAGNYQYPPQYFAGNYGYPMSNPPPPYFAGNCGNPMSIPPQKQTEAPAGIYKYHTAPPSFTHTPPPPRPLHSYAYVEPPYWPTSSSSGGNCVIM
ncbi:unnamed protein product [Thlaspi arvense]|uniref:Uncharacterized protein n=1 Tax=Thlaspi arvense TaxID=13288 RepID=A0AAU9S3A3_THLAR|nr:unnamed protein product [Thlaspi arvense]